VLSVKDSQGVLVQGLNHVDGGRPFLDLRGRQTRDIRLRGDAASNCRPVVVLGIDVPKDALAHE